MIILQIPWTITHSMAVFTKDKGAFFSLFLKKFLHIFRRGIQQTPKGARISLRQSFGWSIYQPFAYMDTVYTVTPGGLLHIKCCAEFSNKVTFLPRFGIRLFVPKSFNRVEYFGYESYIDKHQATYMGNFSGLIEKMHEDYIRPPLQLQAYECYGRRNKNKIRGFRGFLI